MGGLKPADERGGGNTAKLGGGSPSQSTTSSTNQELVEVFFSIPASWFSMYYWYSSWRELGLSLQLSGDDTQTPTKGDRGEPVRLDGCSTALLEIGRAHV